MISCSYTARSRVFPVLHACYQTFRAIVHLLRFINALRKKKHGNMMLHNHIVPLRDRGLRLISIKSRHAIEKVTYDPAASHA